MIAHRASVFEENSVMFMDRHEIKISRAHDLPLGYRATWAAREKLCVAKLAKKVDNETQEANFPRLLLQKGVTAEKDDFVEAHIGGPVSVRTLETVIVDPKKRRGVIAKAARAKLEKYGIEMKGKSWKP